MTKVPARHRNRVFRTRSGTPAPDETLAAITTGPDDVAGPGRGARFRRIGAVRHPWNRREETLLALSGAAFLVASLVTSPLIAIVTLPAALLAPGHLVLRWFGRGFDAPGDPWLVWVLRVVLSLAAWTVTGAIAVVIPALDPRWLGFAAGAGILLLTAARLGSRTGPAGSGPEGGTAWAREGVRTSQAVVVAGFAVIAALAIGGAYVISSTGAARPQPFIALNFADPTVPVYGTNGVTATAVVQNATGRSVNARVQALIDGRVVLDRTVRVPSSSSRQIPLTGVRTPSCWRSLRVQLMSGPRSLRPLPLFGYGPDTSPQGCIAPSAG